MKDKNADLTEGPLLKKIIVYTIPIILTGVLQLLFNAADLVVVAIGTRANNELYSQLIEQNIAPAVYNVGDSITPSKVWSATKSAYRRARTI